MLLTSSKRNILTTGTNATYTYIIASIGVLFSLIFPDYIWIYILSLFIISFTLFLKEKFILFSILVLLLSFVGEINPNIRLVIQIIGFILLSLVVLRNYGFNFEKYPRIPSRILSFLIFLYITLMLSMLNSDHSFSAIPLLLRLSAFFILVYLFFVLIREVKDIKLYINAIIVSALIFAVAVLYDFVNSGFNLLMLTGQIYRTGGMIGNYNATGGYFAISIPLLISSFYGLKAKNARIIFGIIIGILFIALIITGSRSAFLACAVSVFIILYTLNKKLLARITVSAVLALLLFLLIEPIRDFLTVALRIESGLTQRDHLWKISLSIIKDNFLLGIGPGAYAFKMFDYFPLMLNSYEGQLLYNLFQMTSGTNSAHNFYLIMFTDLGILGLIISLMLPYIFFRMSKAVLRSLKKLADSSYYMVVGIVATSTGLFIRAFFDGINIMTYGWISVDLPFWLMFSILAYFYNNITSKKQLT